MQTLTHNWYWARGSVGPYTVIASYITATEAYGYETQVAWSSLRWAKARLSANGRFWRNADIRQITRVGNGGSNRRRTGLIAAVAHDEVPEIARAQPVLGADRLLLRLAVSNLRSACHRHLPECDALHCDPDGSRFVAKCLASLL
jgi:hypothetical protein